MAEYSANIKPGEAPADYAKRVSSELDSFYGKAEPAQPSSYGGDYWKSKNVEVPDWARGSQYDIPDAPSASWGSEKLPDAPRQEAQMSQPEAQDMPGDDPYGVGKAYEMYMNSLKEDEESKRLRKQLDSIEASKQAGIQGTEERTIPMAFITGQQQAIEKRAGVMATPLNQRLAIAQQAAQSQQQQAAAAYQQAWEMAKFKASQEAEAAKNKQPVSLSAGAALIDPATGKVIYRNPSASASGGGVGDAYGLTPAQETKLIQITSALQKNTVWAQGQQADYLRDVANTVKTNPNDAGSQLMGLYTIVKSLDPASAVREGELNLAQSTQSYLARFSTAFDRIAQNKLLDETTAIQLADATLQLANMWSSAANRVQQNYASQARVIGLEAPFQDYMGGVSAPSDQRDDTQVAGSVTEADVIETARIHGGSMTREQLRDAIAQANPGTDPNWIYQIILRAIPDQPQQQPNQGGGATGRGFNIGPFKIF